MAAAEKPELSTLIISALVLLSSFPLCASHLLSLLAFLSPLLATTALLLLLLLASIGPPATPPDSKSPAETTLLRAAAAVGRALEKLRRRWADDECQTQDFHNLRAALEVYRMVFQAAEIPVRGEDWFHTGRSAAADGGADGKPVEIPHRSEETLQEEIRCESAEDEKVTGAADEREPSPELGGGEIFAGKGIDAGATEGICSRKLVIAAPKAGNPESVSTILGSFGSMRKEKEWKRTLACKLFEERHSGNAGEDMDSLWETYESEPKKMMGKNRSKRGAKTTSRDCVDEGDRDEEDDEEIEAAKLCCLQALKFSAGKMNLGMGRPGLLKISKAVRGIGWLHLPVRHGRKTFK